MDSLKSLKFNLFHKTSFIGVLFVTIALFIAQEIGNGRTGSLDSTIRLYSNGKLPVKQEVFLETADLDFIKRLGIKSNRLGAPNMDRFFYNQIYAGLKQLLNNPKYNALTFSLHYIDLNNKANTLEILCSTTGFLEIKYPRKLIGNSDYGEIDGSDKNLVMKDFEAISEKLQRDIKTIDFVSFTPAQVYHNQSYVKELEKYIKDKDFLDEMSTYGKNIYYIFIDSAVIQDQESRVFSSTINVANALTIHFSDSNGYEQSVILTTNMNSRFGEYDAVLISKEDFQRLYSQIKSMNEKVES